MRRGEASDKREEEEERLAGRRTSLTGFCRATLENLISLRVRSWADGTPNSRRILVFLRPGEWSLVLVFSLVDLEEILGF